jgi:hypothetical protein
MVWENKSYPNLNHLAEKAFLLEEVPGSPSFPGASFFFQAGIGVFPSPSGLVREKIG